MSQPVRHPQPARSSRDDLDQTRWSPTRAARLGFLIGRGWAPARIAEDPVVAASVGNVHQRARRFGLAFREAAGLALPPAVVARIDAAADKRRLDREALIRVILIAAGSDASLIDNILDDGA